MDEARPGRAVTFGCSRLRIVDGREAMAPGSAAKRLDTADCEDAARGVDLPRGAHDASPRLKQERHRRSDQGGQDGGCGDDQSPAGWLDAGIRFERNTYIGASSEAFAFCADLTWDDWRAAGQDLQGTSTGADTG